MSSWHLTSRKLHQRNSGLTPNKAEEKYELVFYSVARFT